MRSARLPVLVALFAGLLATGVARAAQPAPAKPRADVTPRTLESIHIKGEIAVPQVLFITARDQRRFMDFQHRHYLKTSREVGERTVLPSRIAVTGNRPNDARKEIAP